MNAIVAISFVVGAGHQLGDYAKLFGDGGSGVIDWDSPLSDIKYPLFPAGAGVYGFGDGPFGDYPFGQAYCAKTLGFGYLPFGEYPFGESTAVIEAKHIVTECGVYKFAFGCYDSAGNVHVGSPEEAEIEVLIAPAGPITGLKKNAYNKTTDVLTLDVDD